MGVRRAVVAATALLFLTACGSPEPTTMNPSATSGSEPTETATVSTPPPTVNPSETAQTACTLLFDPVNSPSLKLVDYLLQTEVTAKDNKQARKLLKRVRQLARRTPTPLDDLVDNLAVEIQKVVRLRRHPGLSPIYDSTPIQRAGRKITRYCKVYV